MLLNDENYQRLKDNFFEQNLHNNRYIIEERKVYG